MAKVKEERCWMDEWLVYIDHEQLGGQVDRCETE